MFKPVLKMTRTLFCLVVPVTLFLAGCAGLRSSTVVLPATKGTATLKITWPVQTRVIPEASNSITIQLQSGGQNAASATIVRPSTSWTSPVLTPGTYTLTAAAYPSANGSGNAQASGIGSVTIAANANTPSSVTMGSTVTALTIVPSSATVGVGGTVQIGAPATDAVGNIVLVANDTIQWLSSDPTIATVSTIGLSPFVTGVKAVHATSRPYLRKSNRRSDNRRSKRPRCP